SIDVELEPKPIDDCLERSEVGAESARELESKIAPGTRWTESDIEVVNRERTSDRLADWQRCMRVSPAVQPEAAVSVGDKAAGKAYSRAVAYNFAQESAG